MINCYHRLPAELQKRKLGKMFKPGKIGIENFGIKMTEKTFRIFTQTLVCGDLVSRQKKNIIGFEGIGI